MRVISPDLYSQWRWLAFAGDVLHEAVPDTLLSERMLQLIWHHQRLLRDQLRTLDHQRLLVLHPGFWNREAGPDFRGAMIRLGTGATQIGDVEIDLDAHSWRGHHHDQNPAYQNVILHVVWDCDPKAPTTVPTLLLKSFLDAPLKELKRWLGRNPLKRFTEPLQGQCCAPLKEIPAAVLAELLRQAALIRLQAKGAEFEARARQTGWEQALWEGIFGALGYKHNVWPMRRIGELLPSILAAHKPASALPIQAALLGVSGLLPGELAVARPTLPRYLRSLWDIWWRFRESVADSALPLDIWKLSGIRPANHPQRRLAAAAHWLANRGFLPRLEAWFSSVIPDKALLPLLLETFQIEEDEFWSWHWTLTSPRLRKKQPLIGPQRATDLAMNVILPWFWIRAGAGKNDGLQAAAEHRYFAWPKSQDNAVLRLARQRLFGNEEKRFLKTAAAQQGLLQIVRDFCDHSNALCENCRFPEFVLDLDSVPDRSG